MHLDTGSFLASRPPAPLSRKLLRGACHAVLLGGAVFRPIGGQALPAGGVVTGGNATITTTGQRVDITQTTNQAIIDWSSFNIANGEHVNFNQPNAGSVALNRIHDINPTQIDGALTANGHVVLVNSNGIFFGANSQVNVSGMVATTADIDNAAFMAGDRHFNIAGNANATIENQGNITVQDAGMAALVAPNVVNKGVIQARLGKVALASGDTFALDMYGDGLVSVEVSSQVAHQLVQNSGVLSASGGVVQMTAAAGSHVVNSLVNNTGVMEANSAGVGKNGEIILFAAGSNAVDGNVLANKGHKTGTSTVTNSGTITATGYGAGETGGKVQMLADNVAALSGSTIDVSGDAGGGTVHIGGDFHGEGTTATALHTIIQTGATIHADAITSGKGGNVAVWADDWTKFAGEITAKGGAVAGDGGFVETSGKGTLTAVGNVDASAAHGNVGQWLLDPNNITIQSAGSDTNVSGSPNFTANNDSAIVTTGSIQTALNAGTSVVITTGSGGTNAQAGDIFVSNTITKSSGNDATLTLSAYRNITVNSAITSTSNKLNVVLHSDNTGTGSGGVRVASNITTNGGSVTIGGGAGAITAGSGYAYGNNAGSFNGGVTITSAGFIDASGTTGGDIIINGKGNNASSNFDIGVVVSGTVKTNYDGQVTIWGYGNGNASDWNSNGVSISGTVSTVNGNLTLQGYGGADNATTGGVNNYGVVLNSGTVQTLGSGSISVTGFGGGNNGIGNSNYGVYINGSNGIKTTNGGAITIDGTGGSGAGNSNSGVYVGGVIEGSGGDILITGHGGAGTTSGLQVGVDLDANISNTGNGDITINGTGGGGGATGGNYGIQLHWNTPVITTTAGDITFNGYGGSGSGGSNLGMYLAMSGSIYAGSGNVTLNSVTGASTTLGMNGVNSAIVTVGDASMTGNVSIYTNSMLLANNFRILTQGGITIAPYTSSTAMIVGGATISSSQLNITDTYLGYMNLGTASSATFGSANAGAMTINTALTYSKPLSFITGSATGDITLTGALSTSSTGNAITMRAARDLILNNNITNTATSGTATISLSAARNITSAASKGVSGSGVAINLTMDADSDANSDGYISLGSGTFSTNGGNITLGGGADPTTTAAYGNSTVASGITLASTTLNAGGGNISLIGHGYNGTNNSNAYGIYQNAASITTSGTGTVSLTGTGGGQGSGGTNHGIYEYNGSSVASTGSGAISVTGIGGNSSAPGFSYGIVTNTGTNTIGGNSATGNITVKADSVSFAANTVIKTTSGGNVNILPYTSGTSMTIGGSAADTTAYLNFTNTYLGYTTWGSTGTLNLGSTDGTVAHATAGTMTTGASAVLGALTKKISFATASGYDLTLSTAISTTYAGSGYAVSAQSGRDLALNTSITDAATNNSGASDIYLSAYRNITSNGSGSLSVTNTTGNTAGITFNSDADGNQDGIVSLTSGTFATNGGNITIGGGAGVITAGSGFAHGNAQSSAAITLTSATLSAAGGNIILNGNTSLAGGGTAINLSNSTVATNGSGSITFTGTSTRVDNSTYYGFYADATTSISTVDGDLNIYGTSTSTAGATASMYGVRLQGGTYRSTGTGNLNITGTVIGSDYWSGGGVLLWSGNPNIYTNSGNLTITGRGPSGSLDISTYGTDVRIGSAAQTGAIILKGTWVSFDVGTAIANNGNIAILPYSTGHAMIVGGASGGNASILSLNNTELSQISWGAAGTLFLGSTDGTVANATAGTMTTGTSAVLGALTKKISFATASGYGLTLSNAISTTYAGSGYAVTARSGQDLALNTSITDAATNNSGASDIYLSAYRNITNNSSASLSVTNTTGNTSGITFYADADANGSGITTLDSGTFTTNGGNITFSGGAVTLGADETLAAGSGLVTFGSTVNGAHTLSITGSGGANFGGAVGGSTALTTLAVTGASTLGGNVTTTGTQSYTGAVTLGADDTLTTTNSNVTFGSTINGAHTLTIAAGSGVTHFTGIVGGSTALTSLSSTGSGGITIDNNITTTGAQSYTGAVTLGGNVTTNSGSATTSFGSTVNGAYNYTGTAGTFSFGGAWGGGTALGAVSLTSTNSITLPAITAASIFTQTTGVGSDITLGGNMSATNTSGTSITLVSADDFFNGSSYTLSTGAGSRWLVYSEKPADNTLGGLTSDFNRYTCTYGGSCPSTPASGNGLMYSYTPTLTITAAAANATYGDAVPTLNGYTTSGYLNATDQAAIGLGGSVSFGTNYSQGSGVGSYNITYGGGGTITNALGYAISYAGLNNGLTIGAKTLTATLIGTVQKTYDTTTTATLASGNYSLSGIYSSDAVTVATTAGTYDTKNYGTGKTVSVTGMTLTGAAASNYVLSSTSVSGAVGQIDKAGLTVSGASAANKVYDGTTTASISGGALSGLLGVDAVTLGGTAAGTFNNQNVGTGKAVTVTGFTVSGADSGNYTFTQPVGITADITQRGLTITASSSSKTYGDTKTFAGTEFTSSGLQNGESIGSVTLTSTGAAAAANVAGYNIVGSAATGGTFSASNYSITYVNGTLTVNPATLTVVADAKSKQYSTGDPALTYSATGFKNGQTTSIMTGALDRDAGENVGSYTIHQNTLSAGSNYTIAYTSAALTIGALPIVAVVADNQTRVYGDANPTLTYTFSGLQNGDTSSIFSGALATTATLSSGVGTYSITLGTLSAGPNYDISFTSGTLTITPATLHVSADALSKVYGVANPGTYTYTLTNSDLKNGDSAGSVLSGVLARAAGENVGNYAINQGTLSATSNYTIAYTSHNFSITPATLTVTADAATRTAGTANPNFTYTITGLVNGDNSSAYSGTPLLFTAANTNSPVGNYSIDMAQGTLSASNYIFDLHGNTLTVTEGTAPSTSGTSGTFSNVVQSVTCRYQDDLSGCAVTKMPVLHSSPH